MLVHVCNSITWQVEAGEIGVQGHSQLRGESEDSLGCRRVCLSEAKHETSVFWRHSFHAVEHTHFKGSALWELTSICNHTATLWPRCSVCPSSGHFLLAPQQLVHFPDSGLRQGLPCYLPWKIGLLQGHTIELNHRASFARVSCPLHVFEAYVCSCVDQ